MIQMNQIYQQVAEKLGIPESQVKNVGEHSFAWLRSKLTNLDIDHPKILYPGLGTFTLIISKLRKAEKSGNLSQADYEKTINLLNKFDKK